jgi:hypothetical protein
MKFIIMNYSNVPVDSSTSSAKINNGVMLPFPNTSLMYNVN